MAKPISAVPQIFATATSPLPLANLDSDFAYVITRLNDLATYSNYVADSGTLNALVLSYPVGVGLSSLTAGTPIQFKPANTNTGAVTLQIQINNANVGSAASVVDAQGNTLTAGVLKNTVVYSAVYDGSKWILVGVTNPTTAPSILPSYAGNSLKYLQVNAGETDITWSTVSGGLPSFTGNALKVLRVNSGATAAEWATVDLGLAQTVITGDYDIVLSDANKQLFQPGSDTTLRSIQIPTNASVPFPIGTTFTFITDQNAGGLEVFCLDSLFVANSTITDLFHLGAKGMATAVKITSTKWIVNGVGVTA